MLQRISSLIACLAAFSFAAEPGPLSLDQVTVSALRRNQDLIAAGDGVAAALAQRIAAAEVQNPVFTAGIGKYPTNRGDPAHDGNVWGRTYDWTFQLQQLIELGGKRGKRQAAAGFATQVAEEQRRDAERTVRAAVAMAYVQVLAAEQRQRIGEGEANSLDKEAAIARHRHEAGDLAAVDAEQIAIAAAQRRVDALGAAGDAQSARIALQVVAGLETEDGWTLADDLDAILRRVPTEALAMVDRPDLHAARRGEDKALADLAVAEAGRIPDPTIGLQFEHNPPSTGDQGDSVGLSLSLPIPILNRNDGAVASADAAVNASRHVRQRLEQAIAAEVAQARAAQRIAQEKWGRWKDGILPLAEHAWSTVSFAYGNGSAALTDLLAANRALDEARLGAAQAKVDAITTAITLRAALGQSALITGNQP